MVRYRAAIAALLVAAFTLAACDKTIRGAGQDISDTADATADAAANIAD